MSIDKYIEGKESEKLLNIGCTSIVTHYKEIPIPEGTKLLRAKKNKVSFFIGPQPDGKSNGWSDVPEGATSVSFPYYRPRSENYGKPLFKYKNE